MSCEHKRLLWGMEPASERGWVCTDCQGHPGEPPGFSPQADRSHTREKVSAVLMAMHDAGIVYVSNGDQGDWVTHSVAKRCAVEDTHDQTSIARYICDIMADARHAAYWREVAQGVLTGNDKRPRCHCGALATCTQFGGGRETTHTCVEHSRLFSEAAE